MLHLYCITAIDHIEVTLVLDRLADVIRASEGFQGSHEADMGTGLGVMASGGSTSASRNGGPLSWWRDNSLTSRGVLCVVVFADCRWPMYLQCLLLFLYLRSIGRQNACPYHVLICQSYARGLGRY